MTADSSRRDGDQRRTPTRLWLAEAAVVVMTVGLGWYVVVDQARSDGWLGGGTGWMALLAAVSTAGGAIGLTAAYQDRVRLAALGLASASVAPTGFAYLGNLALVLLAFSELVRPQLRLVRHRTRAS